MELVEDKTKKLVAEGWECWMILATIPHGPLDQLKDLQDDLDQTWTKTWSAMKLGLKKIAKIEFIRAYEHLHGWKNGWHPHIHALVFTSSTKGPEGSKIDFDFAALFADVWADKALIAGRRVNLQAVGGELAADAAAGAKYIAKGSIAGKRAGSIEAVSREIALGSMKSGRGGLRTPFEIALDISASGETKQTGFSKAVEDDVDLWQEYCTATKAKRPILTSSGIKLDAEPVDREDGIDDLRISRMAYARLVGPSPIVIARLLDAVEAGGGQGGIRILEIAALDAGLDFRVERDLIEVTFADGERGRCRIPRFSLIEEGVRVIDEDEHVDLRPVEWRKKEQDRDELKNLLAELPWGSEGAG